MGTDSGYAELARRIQNDIMFVLEKWKTHFGDRFDTMWDDAYQSTHCDTLPPESAAIRDLVSAVKTRLNDRGRTGEASLLVRDPREDRLVLLYSTSTNLQKGTADSKQVRDPGAHYDPSTRRYFYTLHDRLADVPERESDEARLSRGLTGWVAVAGHYLLVNGEYGQHGLRTLPNDRPETLAMCQTYGTPTWGRHVSEAPTDPQKPKRYIAVPVKSSSHDEGGARTIGVLRYACPCAGLELDEGDLHFLNEIAQLIGATLGLDAATIRAFRESHFSYESDRLRRTYDFGAFLRFVAVSLRSNIASLYIDVQGVIGAESTLRLVDAYGIHGSVGEHRDRLEDYLADGGGFTRWLFDEVGEGPKVEDSVHHHGSWRGKNTALFYGDHFRKFMDDTGHHGGKPTDVARKYGIKIIGIPIVSDGDRIGVLKVELPSCFDDSHHYGPSDQTFIRHCASALGPVLADLRLFLRGGWFTRPDPVRTVINVTRMAAEVFRTRLVSPDEAPAFWSELESYFKAHKGEVGVEMRETIGRLPQEHGKDVHAVADWLLEIGKDVLARLVREMMTRA